MSDDLIKLGHGSGGRMTHELVARRFQRVLGNPALEQGDDAAVLPLPGEPGRLAVTTDAHIVAPLFFPGGDIGRLAVCGTVNDLAVMGARPLWLTASFILEEGLPLATLDRVIDSMHRAAEEAGVSVVAGDTKVAERGKADGRFISTAGVAVGVMVLIIVIGVLTGFTQELKETILSVNAHVLILKEVSALTDCLLLVSRCEEVPGG